eukprot:gene11062-14848_t
MDASVVELRSVVSSPLKEDQIIQESLSNDASDIIFQSGSLFAKSSSKSTRNKSDMINNNKSRRELTRSFSQKEIDSIGATLAAVGVDTIQVSRRRRSTRGDGVDNHSRLDKVGQLHLYEIDNVGSSTSKTMTLRELLNYITLETKKLDIGINIQFHSEQHSKHSALINHTQGDHYNINNILSCHLEPGNDILIAQQNLLKSSNEYDHYIHNDNSLNNSFHNNENSNNHSYSFHNNLLHKSNGSNGHLAHKVSNHEISGGMVTKAINENHLSSHSNRFGDHNTIDHDIVLSRNSDKLTMSNQNNMDESVQGTLTKSSFFVNNHYSDKVDAIDTTFIDKNTHIVNPVRLRDLRRLNFKFNPKQTHAVLIRRHATLLVLDPIRAIIMSSRILIICPENNQIITQELLDILAEHVKDWAHNNAHHSHTTHYSDSNDHNTDTNQPFEFHAYEALLTTIKTLDAQESRKLDKTTRLLITTFNHKYKNSSVLPYEIQEKLREAKIQLSTLQTKINDRRMTLEKMIEDEEEMSLMNLTFLRNKPYLYKLPLEQEILGLSDDIEDMLQSYLIDYNTLNSDINLTIDNIHSIEESLLAMA